ncbi:MAG: hypothetical protein U0800_25985 [Isosphaeraceae bacterium]
MRKATIGRLAITFALAFCTALAIFAVWIIPGSINGRIRALVPGSRARIDRWWISGGEGGVNGLAWFDGYLADSPEWARAVRVETDLGLSALFGGRATPGRILLIEPSVTIRLDRDGRLLAPTTFRRPADADRLSVVEVKDGTLRIEQDGRPPLVVRAIDGELRHGDDGWNLTARTQDSDWGRWRADGQFRADFSAGSVTISGLNISASPQKTACIPWVPPRAWEQAKFRGPMDVRETITYETGVARPVRSATWVNLRGTGVSLPRLAIDVEGVRGEVEVADRVVTIRHANGFALDGTIGADGTIDYGGEATVAGLDIRLDDASITEVPESWRLDALEIAGGRLSGMAKLRASATADRIDLSGSTGEAVVKQAKVRGIPVQSLTIRMHAEGADLRYESDPPPANPPLPSAFSGKLMQAARLMSGLAAIRSGRPDARLVFTLESPGKPARTPSTASRRIEWPPHTSGLIELDHVAIEDLVDEAVRAGIRLPFDATGRISLRLDSTLPLLDPRRLADYRGSGTVEFHGVRVAGIELGEVRARVRLAGGILELSEFRPSATAEIRPESAPQVAAAEEATAR